MEDLVATAENGTKMAKNGRKNGQRMREEEEEAEDEEEQGEVGGAEEGRKRRTRGGRERQGRGERRQSGSRQRRRDPGHEGAERTQLVELGSGHFVSDERGGGGRERESLIPKIPALAIPIFLIPCKIVYLLPFSPITSSTF